MKNKKLLLGCVLLFLIVIILISSKIYVPSSNQVSLPNPASEYCVEQGYNLTIRTNPDGSQTGYCIFPNGEECEEWKYFRGECKNE